ncbi:MAG: methionine--tRNA ligase, partial [Desulfobacterales bacterium]|nr:methionine--tRNA ligase [Desulfobacterales bacterium]
ISMEEFNKVDLRIATVVHAEVIPRAKKLLKIEVDSGKKLTIVAGISEGYNPDDIIGKQVIVVANLKSAKIMGILSKGMLLAGFDGNICALGTVDKKIKPGTSLS